MQNCIGGAKRRRTDSLLHESEAFGQHVISIPRYSTPTVKPLISGPPIYSVITASMTSNSVSMQMAVLLT